MVEQLADGLWKIDCRTCRFAASKTERRSVRSARITLLATHPVTSYDAEQATASLRAFLEQIDQPQFVCPGHGRLFEDGYDRLVALRE